MNPIKKQRLERNKLKFRTLAIESADSDNYRKFKKTEISEDTKNRMEINDIIFYGISQKRSVEQIEAVLLSVTKYKKYEPYFKSWINNQYIKYNGTKRGKKVDYEQERD